MRETIEIGTTPFEEDCAQVGSEDYTHRARKECAAFRSQLRRLFGQEPEGASLFIKSNPHDFGNYYEVACRFDDENEAASSYAYACEGGAPARWDEEARKELGLGPMDTRVTV